MNEFLDHIDWLFFAPFVLYFFFLAPMLICIYLYDQLNPQLLIKLNVDRSKVAHVAIGLYTVMYLLAWLIV
ncbi:MAG TPA: hypothetical protein DEA51_05150 [Erysipelotrichaceae bacterium]|nr:hypothetical protein [Erysipelotrichaceae bacterium]